MIEYKNDSSLSGHVARGQDRWKMPIFHALDSMKTGSIVIPIFHRVGEQESDL